MEVVDIQVKHNTTANFPIQLVQEADQGHESGRIVRVVGVLGMVRDGKCLQRVYSKRAHFNELVETQEFQIFVGGLFNYEVKFREPETAHFLEHRGQVASGPDCNGQFGQTFAVFVHKPESVIVGPGRAQMEHGKMRERLHGRGGSWCGSGRNTRSGKGVTKSKRTDFVLFKRKNLRKQEPAHQQMQTAADKSDAENVTEGEEGED